ncbi:hypothetical protein, partial [Segatella oris]|uniref:hypothetical protein n=1 Tax=Segatella oris TaxID=28135 RepID=UPI00361C8B68
GRGWVLVFSFTNPSSGRALLENIKQVDVNTRCILIVCKRQVISNLLTLRRKMDNEKRQNAL